MTWVVRGWGIVVGKGQRGPGPAQVPGQVAGEHADQHVGPDPFFQPVPDGPQVQVVGFDVPEVPLKEQVRLLTWANRAVEDPPVLGIDGLLATVADVRRLREARARRTSEVGGAWRRCRAP